MRLQWKFPGIVLLAGITVGLVVGGTDPEPASQPATKPSEENEAEAEYARAVRAAAAELNGDVQVRGRIVDEGGNLLNGVSVRVKKVRDVGLLHRPETVDEHTVSGKFSLRAGDCSLAVLEFQKPGYYSHKLQLRWTGEVFDQQEIVLEKIGQLTDLAEFPVWLEEFFGGKETALSDRAFEVKEAAERIVRLAADASREHAVLRVSAAHGPNSFLIREIPREGSSIINRVPPSVVLSLKDGGFILYEPKNPLRARREMKLAPAEGYETKLTLNGDYQKLLPRIDPEKSGIHFFFKYRNLYGRGTITRVEVDSNGERVMVALWMQIQPDGTRNLETGE